MGASVTFGLQILETRLIQIAVLLQGRLGFEAHLPQLVDASRPSNSNFLCGGNTHLHGLLEK